jgi:hypothetical protein
VSITGRDCRVVPRPADATDSAPGFVSNGRLRFTREHFDRDGGAMPPERTLTVRVAALPRHARC